LKISNYQPSKLGHQKVTFAATSIHPAQATTNLKNPFSGKKSVAETRNFSPLNVPKF
jgi:hypothetical protein